MILDFAFVNTASGENNPRHYFSDYLPLCLVSSPPNPRLVLTPHQLPLQLCGQAKEAVIERKMAVYICPFSGEGRLEYICCFSYRIVRANRGFQGIPK